MRLFVVVGVVGLSALAGALSSFSCVLAHRNVLDSGDAGDVSPAPPPIETDGSDADFDCGCCARAVLPFLPSCSGKVAFAAPAADCPRPCTAPVAYVLCEETCYSACACTLPDGYSLVDGGYDFADGGAADALDEDMAGDKRDTSDHGERAGDTDT